MALYKEDLKDLKCSCGMPGCEGSIFIHPRCHPDAPVEVSYFDGVFKVACARCSQEICSIAVASKKNLVRVTGKPITVTCVGCGKKVQTDLEEVYADTKGVPFKDYYCQACAGK